MQRMIAMGSGSESVKVAQGIFTWTGTGTQSPVVTKDIATGVSFKPKKLFIYFDKNETSSGFGETWHAWLYDEDMSNTQFCQYGPGSGGYRGWMNFSSTYNSIKSINNDGFTMAGTNVGTNLPLHYVAIG